LLIDHFLDICAEGQNRRKSISFEGREALRRQPWPGNVRQLKNVIESAVILSDGETIGPNELRLTQIPAPARSPLDSQHDEATWKPIPLRSLEAMHIQQVLEHVHWNKKKAAELLGIERSTLYSRIRNMKLEPPGEDQ
jgi:DNA-binding NtrC family response regulator